MKDPIGGVRGCRLATPGLHHELTDDYGVTLATDLARDSLVRGGMLLAHCSVGREEDRV